jgi:arylsulfatase A-like enzyme
MFVSAVLHIAPVCADERPVRPNVLMIIVDDLNDWVEPLGGHPQVKTPAIRSLAERGTNFRNAHCQSPLCNPSRTSVMLSLRPSTTGIYGLDPWFRNLAEHLKTVSIPQYFARHGYETFTAGKVYHNSLGRNHPVGADPEFTNWGPAGGPGLMPPNKLIPPTPLGNHPWIDWGVFDHQDSQKGDWIVADWAVNQLHQLGNFDKPFFMSIGFFLPHVPCHVTQKWWDMYPEESLVMPSLQLDDRADCAPISWYLHWSIPEPRLSWLEQEKQHKNLVRAYLASVSFMDSQVGRVLSALEASPAAKNTIVVLWSDHGFHLGEKEMTSKNTLWERSTHVPLIFAGPGVSVGVCDQPVELLDIYPTLASLADLPAPDGIEGVSLVPQIVNPSFKRSRPAITDHNPGNSSIRDERYRFIHYADGSEELYDLQQDPGEFKNLIGDASYLERTGQMRCYIRSDCSAPVRGSGQRILERRADGWFWENNLIDPNKPPMNIGTTDPSQLPN